MPARWPSARDYARRRATGSLRPRDPSAEALAQADDHMLARDLPPSWQYCAYRTVRHRTTSSSQRINENAIQCLSRKLKDTHQTPPPDRKLNRLRGSSLSWGCPLSYYA